MSDAPERLRDEGLIAASGRLSIDRARAREQLRRFRLADPHLWVLQIVRAASIAGASEANFTIDADEVDCVFDAALPGDVVADLWNRGYGAHPSASDRAAYQLALGISAASAMNPARIVLETSAAAGVRLTAVNDTEEVQREVAVDVEGTRVYLRERARFGHLLEFFDARNGVLAEIKALRHYCAFSRLKVRVNGDLVNQHLSARHELTIDEGSFRGRMMLERDRLTVPDRLSKPKGRVRVALSKHDVFVEMFVADPHAFGALGVIDSDTLRLDLSSLERVRSRGEDRVALRLVYGPYHELIAGRVLGEGVSLIHAERVRGLVGTLAAWRRRLQLLGTDPAAGSSRLMQRLLDDPFWPRADGPDATSIRSAIRDRADEEPALLVSEHRFEDAQLDEGPILHVSSVSDRRSIREVCSLLGLRSEDCTEWIVEASERAALVADWTQRGRYEEPQFLYREEAHHAEASAWVFVPTRGAFTPELGVLRSVRVFVDGELVEYRAGHGTPFGVVIQGPFSMEGDGRVERDEVFRSLAVEIVRAARLVMDRLARRRQYPEPGTEYHEALAWWLRHTLDGQREALLLRQLGVDESRRDELVSRAWPRAHGLGPVQDVQLFRRWPEGTTSFASLRKLDHAYWIDARELTSVSRMQRVAEEAVGGDMVLMLEEEERDFLGGYLELESAREKLLEHAMEAEYLARPPFDETFSEERVVARHVDENARRRIEVILVDATWPGCEVLLVHRDRLLGTREFRPEFGRFRVIVRSEGLIPDATWSDAASGPQLEHLLTEIRALTTETLGGWWERVRDRGDIPEDPFGQSLYFGVCIDRLVDQGRHRDVPSLPVVDASDAGMTRRLSSWTSLSTNARELGFLPFVRGRLADAELLADAGVPALVVGHGVDDELLGHLFPSTRLRDVTRTVHLEREDVRVAFGQQLQYPRSLLGALVEVPIEATGIGGRIGYYGADGPPRVEVAVLYRERLMTTVTVAIPFGVFRAVAFGESLVPSDDLDDLAAGQDVLERQVRAGARACLVELCQRFEDAGDVALSALRDDALRLLAWARSEGADASGELVERVETVPLFATGTGRRLSVRNLGDIGVDGMLPVTSHRADVNAIHVPTERRALVAQALPEWTLAPVDTRSPRGDRGTEFTDSVSILEPAAEWIRRVGRALPRRRGRRVEVELDWTSQPLGGPLCEVRGRNAQVDRGHGLIDRCSHAGDVGSLFLASILTTEMNRSRRRVSDRDELILQRALLETARDEADE